MPDPRPTVLDAGDSALVLEFGTRIDPEIAARVARLDRRVAALVAAGRLPGVVETVPTFRSLAVLIDPLATDPATVAEALLGAGPDGGAGADGREGDAAAGSSGEPGPSGATRTWVLPVRYGGEHGPDLDEVAERTGLAPEEVVALHADTEVGVYMLGFLPGYAFLGDTDARLHLPRRAEPRTRVPAGSVAVATTLTGVYPVDSPGGWHPLGHCPVPMFDASASPPALLAPGDRVRFEPVDAARHDELRARAAAGRLDARDFRVDRDGAGGNGADGAAADEARA